MALSPDKVRRWVGALFLLAAVLMLIAGQTFLKAKLHDLAFVHYWLICFAFTALAGMTAWLDLRIVRSKSREEQRRLIEKTLQEARKGRPPQRE